MCTFLTHLAHLVVVEAEDRGHRTCANRYGLLHEPPPHRDEPDGVGEIHGTRRHQRRVFTEAVARHDDRPGIGSCLDHAHDRHAGAKQCRLGVLGLVEAFLRAFLTELPEVDAEGL